jgi:hypothetical protein
VLGINDTRQGVGFYETGTASPCPTQAFEFYPNGSGGYTYEDFSPPPLQGQTSSHISSTANGINTLGDVVGTVTYTTSSQQQQSAVWYYSELGYYTFANPKSTGGNDDTFGRGVNYSDGVVGDYVDANGTHGFFVSNPENTPHPPFVTIDASPNPPHNPPYTVVNSINLPYAIAGWFEDEEGKYHGFVGTCHPCNGGALQRLKGDVRTVKTPIH